MVIKRSFYGRNGDVFLEEKLNFVHEFNEVKIRNAANRCRCKICDQDVSSQKIIYLKTFRLEGQPFHICILCWKKINTLVEESEEMA